MPAIAQSTPVLTQREVDRDLAVLDRAWRSDETFVLVPDKSGLSSQRLDAILELLPEELRSGHFILLTSGTTGEPRLVVGSRRRAEALARVLHEQQLSKPVEETIVALPLSYTFAFVNQWVWSRCHRSRLVMTAGWTEPLELRDALKHARNAMICLVGAQVPLLATCFSGCTFGGVIRVHFAGGRFPQERIDEVRAFFPNAMIFNNYGCAEAMPRLTLRQADEAAEASDIGRPLPGVRLRAGKDGSLAFQSPYGAVGFMDSRGFRSIGPDEWVPTGDLGEPTGHGTWRLTGRACEVFKRYGEKVSIPSVLAGVLRRWDGQALSYREADRTGEDGWVLVLGPTPTPEQVRAILAGLRADHPRTRWPLRIESLDSLPVLASGKPDVRAATAYTNRRIHWQQRI